MLTMEDKSTSMFLMFSLACRIFSSFQILVSGGVQHSTAASPVNTRCALMAPFAKDVETMNLRVMGPLYDHCGYGDLYGYGATGFMGTICSTWVMGNPTIWGNKASMVTWGPP